MPTSLAHSRTYNEAPAGWPEELAQELGQTAWGLNDGLRWCQAEGCGVRVESGRCWEHDGRKTQAAAASK